MTERRVVVTGMGLRSPIGNTLKVFCDGLIGGASGVRLMPEWSWIEGLRTAVGGVCDIGTEEAGLSRKHRRSMGRVAVLSLLAAMDAATDSGLDGPNLASPRCGVSFGSTNGGTADQVESVSYISAMKTIKGVQASTYLRYMTHTCAGNISTYFGTQGPLIASTTACVSGSQGIGYGYQAIRGGMADAMICGGAEEQHWMNAVVFDLMMATSSKFNDRPEITPRPFDRDRDGLVVSEGAGCVILEEYDQARKRGARIYGEILGYFTNTSGKHLTASDPESMETCIRGALAQAGLSPETIGHINAHATATPTGDASEAEAVHRVFGNRTPISSLKGHLGHTLGASGALESIASLLMSRDGFMAPTRNLEHPDPAIPVLDHVTGEPRRERFTLAMNNNFAFGGINTSLIFRVDPDAAR